MEKTIALCFFVNAFLNAYTERQDFLFFCLQISCVMVPIGQYTHQLLG